MPECSFCLAPGWDDPAPPNVETVVPHPPHILPDQRVPYLGPVVTRLGSRHTRRDGLIAHAWTWDFLRPGEFNALMSYVFSSRQTASANVTIITIDEENNYTTFNAIAEKPHPGEHYRISEGGWIRDLKLPFVIVSSTGGFDAGFDSGFEV